MRIAFVVDVFLIGSLFTSSDGYGRTVTPDERADTTGLPACIFNLSGNVIERTAAPCTRTKVLLTTSLWPDTIQRYIDSNYMIDLPSADLLDSMGHCIRQTRRRKGEHGFTVGKKGKISRLVKGNTDTTMSCKNRIDYFNDLEAQGDTAICDVHSHPERATQITPDSCFYGKSTANETDMQSWDITPWKRGYTYSQPSIILGYEPDSSQIRPDGRFALPVPFLSYIGFYNRYNADICHMPYKEFDKMIRRIRRMQAAPAPPH